MTFDPWTLDIRQSPPKMENWNHAKEIFYSALHKLPAEREIFLAEVCGDDSQLLSDVKMLIDSYKSEFLEQPILDFHTDSLTEITTDSQFQTGDIINHYIILRMLGRGGMGEVYLARDKKLDRLVAVKILHQGAGKQAEKRLLREARSVAKLEHPNICSIYEVGETDQFPFIVMQFVEGETLDKLIKSNSISVSESIEFTKQIAEALDEAHSHNIIHRDIKPSNIIIDAKKQVKVLDFSLAKKALVETGADTESMLSELGVVAGTVAYMSPEQARGQEIDARSDIWSLGVVFYEMLTGKLPFSGDSKSDIIAAILTKDPPSLNGINPNFSPEFDEILNQVLQKNRDERYSSISEFSDALSKLNNISQDFNQINAVGRNEALHAKTAPANLVSNDSAQHSTFSELTKITDESARNSNKWVIKSKFSWKWFVPAFLAVSVFLGGAYWRFYANSAPKFETFTEASRGNWQISSLFSAKRKPNGAITDVSFSPDGKLIVFLSSGEGASDIYIKQIDQGDAIKITDGKWKNQSPVWSSDGQRLAYISNRDNKLGIWTVSYLGGTPILNTPLEAVGFTYQLRKWSNDKKRVYAESASKLITIELDSRQIFEIKLPEVLVAGSFRISNDEKMITYVVIENDREKIWVQSLETGVASSISKNDFANWSPVIFPNNQKIAYSSNQNGNFQIYVSDISGLNQFQVTFGDSNTNIPIISPNTTELVYLSELDEANIFLYDLKLNKETQLTSYTKLQLFPDISPNNEKLVFQVTDDEAKIFASPLKIKTLGDETEPTTINQRGGWAKWSPNGDEIAFLKFSGLNVDIWKVNVANQKEKQLTFDGIVLEVPQMSPYNQATIPFSWSSDSKKIAYITRQKETGQYNVVTVEDDGSTVKILTENNNPKAKLTSPVWSPKGNQIAFIYRLKIEENMFQYFISIFLANETRNIFQSDLSLRLLGWFKNGNELLVAVKQLDGVDLVKISPSPKVKPLTLTKLKEANIDSLKISPDSQKIVFSARRNGVDNIYIYSINGKEIQMTSNLENSMLYSGITWSPDGNSLSYSKQTGGIQISMITDIK